MNLSLLLLFLLLAAPGERESALAAAREKSWAGDADAAVELYRAYLERWPDDPAALREYARNLGWQGNHGAGLEALDDFDQRFGADDASRRDRARLLVGGGWPRAARRLLEEGLLEAAPNDAGLHGLEALALHHSGEPSLALEHLGRARQLDPRDDFVAEAERRVELPQHHQLAGSARYYQDSDRIEILRRALRVELGLGDRNRLGAFAATEKLEVDFGKKGAQAGLATHDRRPIDYRTFGLDLHRVSPLWQGSLELGHLELRHDSSAVGRAELLLTPADTWQLAIFGERELFAVSPRAVELAVFRQGGGLHLEARPNPFWWLDASARHDELSGDVSRFELHFAPRRQALRREHLNLDLGLRAQLFGFSDDLHQGYYAPELYQRYTATLWLYWKAGRSAGTSVVADAGFYRDDRDATWRFGGDLAIESRFGTLRHFEGLLRLAASKNSRGASGAFDAQSAELLLRGRF